MFFCHKWLSSGGKLQAPWTAATFYGSTSSTESTASAIESDLKHICNDLSEVVNSNSKKKEHRISLRLASHLIYGTCLIYKKKALELLNDCSFAFVEDNQYLINQRLNLALYKIPDSEVDSERESIESCVSVMYPTDQELQDADIHSGHTSGSLNSVNEDEEIEVVRNIRRDSLSVHSSKTIDDDFSDFGETSTPHFAKNNNFDDLLNKQQMISDEVNCNPIKDVLQIYNCDYSLHDTPQVSGSSLVSPTINKPTPQVSGSSLVSPTINKPTPKGLLQSQSVKIHDTYKNFIEDFTLEISTDWKRKLKRNRKVVDTFKQFRSKYVRLQMINLMCHLRCQTPLQDIVDIQKESTKLIMDPKQTHGNSKVRNSMYRRNLLTRKRSVDKNLFVNEPSPPEELRQKKYPSEGQNDSDINVFSDDTVHNSPVPVPAPLPFFDKCNQKEIGENSSHEMSHDQTSYVTIRKKYESRINSNSSLINIRESPVNNMGGENEHINEPCEKHSNMNCENEHVNMDCDGNQSVYILFPQNQKNEVKIEELKMFIGCSKSSKTKILNEFFNQQNPSTRFSSNPLLRNNKAVSARRSSPFSRILEKSLISEEWNEFGVFEKLNKLWSCNNKVSLEMLLKEAPLGPNPSSTMAKIFSSLMNLKTSHFVQILKNSVGQIQTILKGPASRMRTAYHPYSM